MSNEQFIVDKLVVIGLGLIGGSFAAALKATHCCREVIGIARSQETCIEAKQRGIVDRAFCSIHEVGAELGEGDLIFIAVPTLAVESVFEHIKHAVSSRVTITDGASVKGSVLAAAIRVFGEVPPQLVLGHPIAGSEKSGITAANADLYKDHRVILTSTNEVNQDHWQKVCKVWKTVGAQVLEMSVAEHDDVLAATSHLPHIIAYSLVDTLANDAENENIFRYAAGGFRDFTRIASSDPVMWHDIMQANRSCILKALDLFSDNLANLRTAIETQDSESLLAIFTRAKAARDHFTHMLTRQAHTDSMNEKSVIFCVQPGGKICGTLRVPGDKSISHRAVMLGALAEGITEIKGFLEGEDALATLQAFKEMGVVIDGPTNGEVTIHGVGLHGLQPPAGPLYLGNSGTAMRLLAGLLAGQSFDVEITGDESLSQRPMNRVVEPLRQMQANISTCEKGVPPIRMSGGSVLQGIDYTMPMASAQVKSCLLLAGLYAEGSTSVTEPAPTRDHTERMLAGFDYQITRRDNTVELQGGGKLRGTEIEVPADISSATFFMVAASIAPGSDITLTHVGINPTRIGAITILHLMGADLTLLNERTVGGEPVADIRVRYAPLRGIRIPEDQVPLAIDEFPVLFIAAACAEGETVLTGAKELRVKECDRIQAMAVGLETLGINAKPTADGMIIQGGKLGSGCVDSLGDHRIAMAFAVAALRASGEIRISDCANIATSFPGFANSARKAGISLEVYDA